MPTFAGKVAVVTGASSGIGWALAKQLALEGCKVGLIARREAALLELASQLRTAGGTVAIAVADVAEREQVEKAIASVRAELGPVDLVIANAGVGKETQLDPVNIADVEAMFRVNVLGMIYTFAAVMPEMLKRKTGHLVGISSLAGYSALPGEQAYTASKAAVITYLAGLRMQLRSTGIRVTTVCPGFVKTPMTESFEFHMPQLLEADEAARRIVRAVRRGKKVYDFPWPLSWITKLSRYLPDWLLVRVMGGYDTSEKKKSEK